MFIIRSYFLLIHFLVVEYFELPKSTVYVLSVSLILKNLEILSCFISFFYLSYFPDDVLCKIAIWANEIALNSSFGKSLDLSQQAEIAYELRFDLKNMKMLYQLYQTVIFCIQLYIHIWEIILYWQVNPYRFKTKNINNLIFYQQSKGKVWTLSNLEYEYAGNVFT